MHWVTWREIFARPSEMEADLPPPTIEEQVADLSIWDMDPLALSDFSLRLFMVGRCRLTPS